MNTLPIHQDTTNATTCGHCGLIGAQWFATIDGQQVALRCIGRVTGKHIDAVDFDRRTVTLWP